MCRSIITLRRAEPPTDDDVHAAALQFVRKVSGYRQPAKVNAEAFETAVADVARTTRRLLDSLVSPPPRHSANPGHMRTARALPGPS